MKIAIYLTLIIAICAVMPPQTPIIGVYTLPDDGEEPPINGQSSQKKSVNSRTYFAASYVKFIEMSGAQVIPIFSYNNTQYLDDVLSKVNGVLFTGGGMDFNIKLRWTANADYILKHAIASNKQGNPFPIWGTCLGMQLLAYLTSGYDPHILSDISNQTGVTNTIQILEKSYLYDGIDPYVRVDLEFGKGILYFNHHFAVSTSYFKSNTYLKDFWKLTSVSTSVSGEQFVSTLEAKSYPIFAIQFHPEKNLFEWKVNAVRSDNGAKIVQILSNRFVEIARQNKNAFQYEQFKKLSIYNYEPSTATISFSLVYYFAEKVINPTEEKIISNQLSSQ